MDVQCARTYLQEMRIRTEEPDKVVHGLNAFLLLLHGMNQQQVSVVFRSAAQHFEAGGNPANLFWIGKRDIPGSWVDEGNSAYVSSFIAILQFENAMHNRNNFNRQLHNWLKKQCIPGEVVDKTVRWARVFTARESEAMGLRYETPLEIDAGILGDFERLSQIARPKDADESRELRHLLGKCTEWMEENNIPDEVADRPMDELFEAVTEYSASGGASASAPSDGLMLVDRNTVQICDAAPDVQYPTGPPTTYGPGGVERPALADEPDDPVDSCDELERELVANQTVVPVDPTELSLLYRRMNEPAGYALYVTSVPVLIAHRPMQRLSPDEAAEVLAEQFRKKHGAAEPGAFKDAMLKIAECYREAVDAGLLAQRDRVGLILPPLTVAYKKLFDRKAASICAELKGEIARIVLHSKCKNCGASFTPSDQSIYDTDENGVEVAIGKKHYNTRDFCEARCEQRWQCFRCKCGRPLQKGRTGTWLMPRCSMCGVGRPMVDFAAMNNILSGVAPNWEVRQFYTNA